MMLYFSWLRIYLFPCATLGKFSLRHAILLTFPASRNSDSTFVIKNYISFKILITKTCIHRRTKKENTIQTKPNYQVKLIGNFVSTSIAWRNSIKTSIFRISSLIFQLYVVHT